MKIHRTNLEITKPSVLILNDLQVGDWYAEKEAVDEYYAEERSTLYIWKNAPQHPFPGCNCVTSAIVLKRNAETTFLEDTLPLYSGKDLKVYKVNVEFKTTAIIKINR